MRNIGRHLILRSDQAMRQTNRAALVLYGETPPPSDRAVARRLEVHLAADRRRRARGEPLRVMLAEHLAVIIPRTFYRDRADDDWYECLISYRDCQGAERSAWLTALLAESPNGSDSDTTTSWLEQHDDEQGPPIVRPCTRTVTPNGPPRPVLYQVPGLTTHVSTKKGNGP